MKLLELKAEEDQTYQSLVQINGSFLQDFEWGTFQESLGKTVLRFGIYEEERLLLGVQGYLQGVLGKEYFFIPYGPTISLESLSHFQEYFKFFCTELKKRHPHLIFVRFEPLAKDLNLRFAKKSIDLDPHQTLILDLKQTEEQLLSSMHPKTRYNIKLAKKHGVEIEVLNELSDQAEELLLQTSKRAGIRGFDRGYYKKLVRYFRDDKDISAKVYMAKHQGDLLAANIVLTYKKQNLGTYLFGGSSDIKRNHMAPYLLHWQTILNLKEQGLEKYDFWGIEINPEHSWFGFSKFKLGFGGEIVKYAGTWDYVLNSAWYNIYIILRKLNRIIK